MKCFILPVAACAILGILASAEDSSNIADLDAIAVRNLTEFLIASDENAKMNKFVSKPWNIRVTRRALTKNLVASEKNVNLYKQDVDEEPWELTIDVGHRCCGKWCNI
jgi:hypothetical protein